MFDGKQRAAGLTPLRSGESDGPIPDIDIDPDEPIDPAIYAIVANETTASVDDAQAWAETDNGHAVSETWSGYSAMMHARAEVKRAEYASAGGMGEHFRERR